MTAPQFKATDGAAARGGFAMNKAREVLLPDAALSSCQRAAVEASACRLLAELRQRGD